ncbi:MAG: hypothetical protein H0U56_13660, partial [Methylibium sp.]|nr:hypothetical protein [Methylibium sp.]
GAGMRSGRDKAAASVVEELKGVQNVDREHKRATKKAALPRAGKKPKVPALESRTDTAPGVAVRAKREPK